LYLASLSHRFFLAVELTVFTALKLYKYSKTYGFGQPYTWPSKGIHQLQGGGLQKLGGARVS